ncbi:MAG TPA: hypothetical protein VFJ02_25255, partial [Vicinamibacterales bacterium]|nr:hypothetical protein [Vicinamibacterales bacterium]
MTRAIALFLLAVCIAVPGSAAPALRTAVAQQDASTRQSASEPARVVVTISTEGLRIPAVTVQLRSLDRNIVIGRTT